MSKFASIIANKLYPLKRYVPSQKNTPPKIIQIPTAWKGLEEIIEDILIHFEIERESCIEFGVEFGFSTVIFSNYFKIVKGIDIFIGDEHTSHQGDHFESTKKLLSSFENIVLFKSNYKDWIIQDTEQYNFAHVDIVHSYKDTYECGIWAAMHSKCCIFHDTESFPSVKRAVYNIAKKLGKEAYNYPFNNGLGIIV